MTLKLTDEEYDTLAMMVMYQSVSIESAEDNKILKRLALANYVKADPANDGTPPMRWHLTSKGRRTHIQETHLRERLRRMGRLPPREKSTTSRPAPEAEGCAVLESSNNERDLNVQSTFLFLVVAAFLLMLFFALYDAVS